MTITPKQWDKITQVMRFHTPDEIVIRQPGYGTQSPYFICFYRGTYMFLCIELREGSDEITVEYRAKEVK